MQPWTQTRCASYQHQHRGLEVTPTVTSCALQALKMLADYQQTVRRPNSQPAMTSTRSQVLSQRIVAMKPNKQSQSNSQGPVAGLSIPSIGPFVNGSDGNLQEVTRRPYHNTPHLCAVVCTSGCLSTRSAVCLLSRAVCLLSSLPYKSEWSTHNATWLPMRAVLHACLPVHRGQSVHSLPVYQTGAAI